MQAFKAACVGTATIDGVLVLVFAENADASGMRLEIQGSPYDEQDVALGMDAYCLCVETGACHYGGIEHWEIDEREGRFRVLLDEAAARTLEVQNGFVIEIASEHFASVRAAMKRIFELSRFGVISGGRR